MLRYPLILSTILMFSACATGGDEKPAHPDFAIHMPFASDSEETRSVDLAPCFLRAETVLSKPSVSLEDLLQIADEYSPEIQTAREEITFSGKLWQTESLLNATTECQENVIPMYNDDGGAVRTKTKFLSIKKIIPGGRNQAAAGTATSAERESRLLRFEQKRREVFGQIHALFIELLYFKQAQALYQQLIQDAREMSRVASLHKNLKTVSNVDSPASEIGLVEFERASFRLAREGQTYSQRLAALLGGKHVPVERLSGELLADFPRVEPSDLFHSLEEHPKLLAARKEAEAAAIRLNQAKAQYQTDVDFRLGIGRDLVEGDRSIMGGLSIPLPEFPRKKGGTREVEYHAQKTSDAVRAVEDSLRAELTAAYSEYLSAQDRVAVSRDQLVPDVEKAFAETQEEYLDGKRNLRNVFDARLALNEARLSYLVQLRDCNLAHARIVNLTEESETVNER
jgi:cobalt-zinc-cadmium efflux system outer membrane protein